MAERGDMTISPSFEQVLDWTLGDIKDLLLRKNRDYGNSIINPTRVFTASKHNHNPVECINVRLDDKLSRVIIAMKTGKSEIVEECVIDIVGYLVIRIAIYNGWLRP